MGRSSKAITNTVFGLILKLITLTGPFVIRIAVTWTLGKAYLGISGVFSSILTMLSLSELGFASAVAYKCYSLYAEQNYKEIGKYLNFFRNVYRVVGTAILTFGLLLVPFLEFLVDGDIPSDINLYVVYFIYLLNTSISYYISAYRSVILTVTQRIDIESKIESICHIATYIIQIILIIKLRNYYWYLVLIPIQTIAINLIRNVVTNKKFPEFKTSGTITKEEKKELFGSLVPLFGHRLFGTLIISADNIVISAFLGVIAVADYNNYFTIISALGGFIVAIYGAIQPGIGNSMSTEGIEKNYHDFKKISFGMVWLVGWMSICLLCLFQDFIRIAYGQDSVLNYGIVILLVVEFYVWRTFDILMTYRDVVGKWGGDAIIPYIGGIFNLLMNVILVKLIGMGGVVLATILTFVIFSIPNSIRVLFRSVFKKPLFPYLREYLCNTLVVVLVGVITYFCCKIVNGEHLIISFVLKCLLCTIVPNAILVLMWRNKQEFLYFYNMFKLRVNEIKRKKSAL